MKYEFKENEDVAHIDNLTQKLTVRNAEYFFIQKKETDKMIRKIRGITCYWWSEGKLQENMFHSERLVPWVFAQRGLEESERWLKEMGAKQFQV
jgi:hypothetical protein